MSELTPSEQWVKDQLKSRGWEVHRNGWPDFMCARERHGGLELPYPKYLAVEVKGEGDTLSPAQVTMHKVLSDAGLAISVINPDRILRDFKWLKGRPGSRIPLIDQELIIGHVSDLKSRLISAQKTVEALEAEVSAMTMLSEPTVQR